MTAAERASMGSHEGVGRPVEDALISAGEDAVIGALLPSNHGDPDVRDRTDAGHADLAFTGILGSAVAYVSLAGAATIAATLGLGAPVVAGAIASAAALIRASWASMSYHEKARIWRGEIGR
jgi:hypothetical protein